MQLRSLLGTVQFMRRQYEVLSAAVQRTLKQWQKVSVGLQSVVRGVEPLTRDFLFYEQFGALHKHLSELVLHYADNFRNLALINQRVKVQQFTGQMDCIIEVLQKTGGKCLRDDAFQQYMLRFLASVALAIQNSYYFLHRYFNNEAQISQRLSEAFLQQSRNICPEMVIRCMRNVVPGWTGTIDDRIFPRNTAGTAVAGLDYTNCIDFNDVPPSRPQEGGIVDPNRVDREDTGDIVQLQKPFSRQQQNVVGGTGNTNSVIDCEWLNNFQGLRGYLADELRKTERLLGSIQ